MRENGAQLLADLEKGGEVEVWPSAICLSHAPTHPLTLFVCLSVSMCPSLALALSLARSRARALSLSLSLSQREPLTALVAPLS